MYEKTVISVKVDTETKMKILDVVNERTQKTKKRYTQTDFINELIEDYFSNENKNVKLKNSTQENG